MLEDIQYLTFYFLSCLLRLWSSTLPGYIHPDEFFQSPEIMGEDIFGYEVFRPWEFEKSPQCRSIIVPALTIGVPFSILNTINTLVMKLGFNDYTAYTIARKFYPRNTFRSLLVFSSSYILLTFYTRPFSNSFESIVFALCFCIYVKGSSPQINNSIIKGNLIFTPLNNIIYNLDTKNLAEHGLHPRYLHCFNFFLLFGPITVLTMKDFYTTILNIRFSSRKTYKTAGIVPIMQKLQYQSIGFRNCEEFNNNNDYYYQCEIGDKIILPEINSSKRFITNIIFYKTYMPPRHLLGYHKSWRNTNVHVNVFDLAGSPLKFSALNHYERTLLVTPSTTDLSKLFVDNDGRNDEKSKTITTTDINNKNKLELELIDQHWPHLNADDINRLFSHGIRESHEVIAVGRGRGKSHENNEDIDSVKGDHASFFSEIILQGQSHSNTAYDKDNTEPSKEIEEMKKSNHQLKFSREVTTVIRGTIIPAKLLIIPVKLAVPSKVKATYATIGNT
nr:13686_t:CDS:10 [Entrophospora candida]